MSEGGAPAVAELRREIALERNRLVQAVSELRTQVDEKRRRPVKIGLPVIAGAAVAGFVLAGGVRATIRLLGVRRRRELQRGGLVRTLVRR